MLDINWNPIIFHLATFEIRWYGLMVVLAVITVIGMALLEAKRRGFSQEMIWDMGLWAVVGGIVGARLLHVIDKWNYYINHPEQLLNFAGLAIWGAVLGGLAAIIIYCLIKKISFWEVGDILAPGAILAQAVGRVGCLVNGCCFGMTCDLPIAIFYEHPDSYAPHGIPLYPTQVFHIIWNLIGFVLLWLLRKKMKPQGALFLLWLIYFSVGDFLVHLYREGDVFMFNLQQAQVVDIGIVIVAIALLIVRIMVSRKPAAAAEINTNGQNPEG
jgi:phosphatidylglycerol:prolipoprotein diacylglycerol transferase